MRKLFLASIALLLLSGCFETDFKFKTTVKPDGSIIRETNIKGRGADRFAAPAGKGWQVKKYETKSGQSILDDKYYHVEATGRFSNASEMGSDYRFDSDKQFDEVSDEERQNFISLGLTEPFSENIFSKNYVQLVKYPGLLKSTFEYQEIFQNKGIIELLLNDLKKEVIRGQNIEIPSNKLTQDSEQGEISQLTIEGQLLSSKAVDEIASERLQKEILSHFNYRSEVTMPGKILASNAGSIAGQTAIWQFSLTDFELNHSRYVLSVKSEMIEWKRIILILIVILAALFGLSFIKKSKPKKSKK